AWSPRPSLPWNQSAVVSSRSRGAAAPGNTGTSELQISAEYKALFTACGRGTLPATTVMAATRISFERRAMIRATASSEAGTVSMRKVQGIFDANIVLGLAEI